MGEPIKHLDVKQDIYNLGKRFQRRFLPRDAKTFFDDSHGDPDQAENVFVVSDGSTDEDRLILVDNHHVSVSMTNKSADDSLKEGCDDNQDNTVEDNQDNDEVAFDCDVLSLDSLRPNAESQQNKTMPFHMIQNKNFPESLQLLGPSFS